MSCVESVSERVRWCEPREAINFFRSRDCNFRCSNQLTHSRNNVTNKLPSTEKQTSIMLRNFVAAMIMVASAHASIDNKGTEFIMGFLENSLGGSELRAQIHLTSDVATSVTIEHPVGTALAGSPFSVIPGAITEVTLADSASMGWTANAVSPNLIRASAADEFVAYMINVAPYTSDAGLALPVDTMNTEYIVIDYNPAAVGGQFLVSAAYDNTMVTITPKTHIQGHSAGTPFNVVLNRGEGYFGESLSASASNTLTGTTISANRPVGLTNGNGCTNVPLGVAACDHIFEIAQPVQSWGLEVGVANLPQRPGGSRYRIVASQDATTVTQNGGALVMLNAAEFFETDYLTGNHVFRGDKPIYVTQYMTGDGAPGAAQGDPAMGNMMPFAQYTDSYVFSTVGGGQFVNNYVTIIANNLDVGSLTLDGSPVPAASFTAIPTTSFSAAIVPLVYGAHSTVSMNPHGITVEGYNDYDSYIFPGGALFQFINPVGDENAPTVTLSPQSGHPPTVDGLAWDARPTEDTNGNGELDVGEDLNGNELIDEDTGIFFIDLGAGSTNLVLTPDPFTPGDPSVVFEVSLIDPSIDGSGTVIVTDGAGNEAEVPVTIIVNQPPICSDAIPSIDVIWPPNHRMVEVAVTGVTDPDGDEVSIEVTSIAQDEPVNEVGDGNTEVDGQVDGASAWVRAERAGVARAPGNGRVYRIGFAADDGNDGSCEGVVRVGVPHDKGRRDVPIDDGDQQLWNSVDGTQIY